MTRADWDRRARANISREGLCRTFAWAVPDQGSLDLITTYSPICDVGAGTGYWAWMLSQNGCDVIAYDTVLPFVEQNTYHDSKKYFAVRQCDENFKPPSDRTLMMCWPPYADPMAATYLKRYKGDTLIYIGENDGGCTADGDFFSQINHHWQHEHIHQPPQWDGINDYLWIYSRRKGV